MFIRHDLVYVAGQFVPIDAIRDIVPFGDGRINDTYRVTTTRGRRYVLQRLATFFRPEVLEDAEHIVTVANARGFFMATQHRTHAGTAGFTGGDERTWRLLDYVPGRTIHGAMTRKRAARAMALVGAFHATMANVSYEFRHRREGAHDTHAHLDRLVRIASTARDTPRGQLLAPLTAQLFERRAEAARGTWETLPCRIIHGDLKRTNIRFHVHDARAVTLLDYDTFANASTLVDFADAARDWCNISGEDAPERAAFDLRIFDAMCRGYAESGARLSTAEQRLLPDAIARMTFELAVRFTTDAYEERYFTLDPVRYPDLSTQNRTKATTQLRLGDDIIAKKREIARIIRETLG